MEEIKAPNSIPGDRACLFLAGSIQMGSAGHCQESVVRLLEKTGWVILNPRRDEWDSSWEQSIDNPLFVEQVSWDLQGLEQAEMVLVYFDPNTKGPITLLELGYLAGSDPGKVIVVCPPGFWRKGNVDILFDRHNVRQIATLEEAVEILKCFDR